MATKQPLTRFEMFEYLHTKISLTKSYLFNLTLEEITITYIAYRQHQRNERNGVKKNEIGIQNFINRPHYKPFN